MGDLFKAFSSGLAQFVYAWILPSAIACGVFAAVVLPTLGAPIVDLNLFLGSAVYVLSTLTLSVAFAYAARPIYRFLEGYSMPRGMARRLLKETTTQICEAPRPSHFRLAQ